MGTASIRIAGQSRDLLGVEPRWIVEQIERRRRDGQVVCVEVMIKNKSCDMRLSTPACVSPGGHGRRPNCAEEEVFALWRKLGLNDAAYSPGSVVAFAKQVARMLER